MKLRRLFPIVLLAPFLQAHVGSPDVYLDAQAGPYKLFITVRPPTVIPGVAEVEVRAESTGVREIRAVPVPLSKAVATFAPVADKLKVSSQDPQFFTGSLWMMASGSWQVRLSVEGAQGSASVAIPVPAVALTTKPMQSGLALTLFALMWLLIAGLVLIVGASVREARLPAGVQPSVENKRRAQIAMAITFVLVFFLIGIGDRWWNTAEENYRSKVYKPLEMAATVSQSGTLDLRISNPEWMNQPFRNVSQNGPALFTRMMDDFVPDHEHLMHLYAIREPGMDSVYHLHPELIQTGLFRLHLPAMEPGTYRLYGDVVHANGFAETMTAAMNIPAGTPDRPSSGDDAQGKAAPWKAGATEMTRFTLPDGYIMEWLRPAGRLQAKQGIPFRFRLLDAQGRPASHMEFYMGMLGHAAFVRSDGSTFAHVHPTGSVPMASYIMAQSQFGKPSTQMAGMDMSGMDMSGMDMSATETSGAVPNEVMFPYGFPSPGQYRVFVQMKHSGTIETGVFDASVQ